MKLAINNEEVVLSKGRGRPKGSIDPKVQEAKKVYSQNQVSKLEDRKERLLNELQLIEEKINKHNNV